MYIKTDDFYKDISADVDKWFDTSSFNKNDNRPLEIGKNKKVLGKFKDEIGGRIMAKFVALRAETYSFLIDEYIDDDYEKNKIINKKAKGTKNVLLRERETLFNNDLDSLLKNKVLYRTQQRFRSDHHKVYTEEVNKIALSSNDDNRIQTFDKVTTYPYDTNVFKVCEKEMLLKRNRSEMDDYSSILKNHSKMLKSDIGNHRDNIFQLNNKLSIPRYIFKGDR